ncbi:hypothetical protein [uncultured Jannaschia sp.]|uniref:hypothetical protein n=1 Tax=uncultured Jannaschia sp. TaxID=293347 RepID=UPI0034464391
MTDSGAAVYPDGICIQTKGGIVQGLSWGIYEEVILDRITVTSIGWSSNRCCPSRRCRIQSTCMSSPPGRAVPRRARPPRARRSPVKSAAPAGAS